MIEPGQPHKAIFFVLAYLPLFELLRMSEVCQSLRDAVNDDVLLWLDLFIEQPLSLRISDNILMKIASKAQGKLRTLALLNCMRITDEGLEQVLENNPRITKLYVPGCTSLTSESVIRVVKRLTDCSHDLKFLRMHGLCNTNREQLETIYSCLRLSPPQQQQPIKFLEFRRFSTLRNEDPIRPIDVGICPKCNDVEMVFDCPRESCISKQQHPLTVCIGCCLCIPRCEECGGCVDPEELEEAVCKDILCRECWLQLPKCNLCNKPYCPRHADQWQNSCRSTGFICDVCQAIEEEASD